MPAVFLCFPLRDVINRMSLEFVQLSLETGVRLAESYCGQSPASKNVSMEAGYRHQAPTGKDTADWEDFVRTVVNLQSVWL
jgi:hypothetical protein